MKRANQHCCTVQEFPYQAWDQRISLWLCWWNACYLGKNALKRYLAMMMLTLRRPCKPKSVYKGRNHAGYIILAEPIGNEAILNNHNGQSLLVRPAEWYETLFKDLCLDVISRRDYESYMANKNYEINAERVWLLQESPYSPSFN